MPGNAPRTSGIKCSRRAVYLGGYRQLPPNKFAVATCKDPRLSSVQSQIVPWAPGRNAQLKKLLPFRRMITAPATGASAVLHARRKRSISLSAVVVEPTSRSGTQTDWKKIAFVQCAAERRRYFLCISMAPKNRIFLPAVAEGSQNSVRKSRSILILRKKAAR
jgi:hypothetical protein